MWVMALLELGLLVIIVAFVVWVIRKNRWLRMILTHLIKMIKS